MKARYLPWVVALLALLCQEPVRGQDLSHATEFRVKLLQPLDTETTKKGDKITALVLEPEAFKDDAMEGTVNESKSGHKVKGPSKLGFSFATLNHGGRSISIESSIRGIVNLEGKTDIDDEGHVVQKANNLGKSAAATGAGALIGAVLGGGKGAAIGAGAGALASLVFIEVATQGPRVCLKTGSQLILSVKQRR